MNDFQLTPNGPFVAEISVDFKSGTIKVPPDMLLLRGDELLRRLSESWPDIIRSYDSKKAVYVWAVLHSGVTSLGDEVPSSK